MNVSTITTQKRNLNKRSISDRTLDEIVQRLIEGLQPERIILFGSHAYGHPTTESDLDLMIIIQESNELAYRREQAAYKCVGPVGVSKDLLVLTREEFESQARVATSLARRVKEKGMVLYERGKAHRGLKVAGQKPA